jgi:hypothetical protein
MQYIAAPQLAPVDDALPCSACPDEAYARFAFLDPSHYNEGNFIIL